MRGKSKKPKEGDMQKSKKFILDRQTLLFHSAKKTNHFKALFFTSFLLLVGLIWYSFSNSNSIDASANPHVTAEFNKLNQKYQELNAQIQQYSHKLEVLHNKDANVYKMVYGVKPEDENIWQGGTGGKNLNRGFYNNLWNFNISNIEDKATKLEHQLLMQSKSLDNLYSMAKDKEKYFNSIPSVIPVEKDLLQRNVNLLSGFGRRLHPIFKIWKKHEGLDLTCPKGTSIIAPGAGIVKSVNGHGRGYGNHIVIDHGYGYETLFAHLSAINVHEGQKVERGQVIGKVGETGYATAPHLHYEVHQNGSPVNPIDFVMDGLTTAEYQTLIKQAAIEGKSMD